MQQEQNSENTNNNNKRENQQANVRLIWSVSSTATAIHVFLLGVFLLSIFLPDYVPDRADRAKVFIESMFSLAIVVVVVVHAMMYFKQAKAMDAQVQQSERAVKAAENNVETVEKTAIYANRAYVVAKIRDVGNAKEFLGFRLRIENSGNTPANKVIVSYDFGLRETPPCRRVEGTDLVEYDPSYSQVERLGVVAPKASYHVISTPGFTILLPDQLKKWNLENLRFYCWGRIYYETIFDEKRHTDFCFYQSANRPDGYPCEYGNEAF